jgi:prepilin-type N-terminal cleavage/methylation domain-containing protein
MPPGIMGGQSIQGEMMRRARGFTLIEIAVVLVIAALMIALFAALGSGLLSQQKRQTTNNRLAGIDAALVQYVQQQKRLPCPADGTGTAGIEMNRTAAGCGVQTNGVVPWLALGLPESEILDGWGRRITYRVDALLAADNKMNMSKCDPAGTLGQCTTSGGANTACTNATGLCGVNCSSADLSTCTSPSTYVVGRGLTLQNVAGASLTLATPNTAAAYVLISHGESGGGGYLSTGTIFASTTTDGNEEQKNYANLALQAYYVDDQTSDVAGATHFDDIVMRPTILSVITRAGLGPRSH